MYRFQFLAEFNRNIIDSRDKTTAKLSFHFFDRVLCLDNVWMPISESNANKKSNYRLKKFAEKIEWNKVELKANLKRNYEWSTKYVNDIISK